MNTPSLTPAARASLLIPDCAARPGDDPIFALNAEAVRRRKAGEIVVNATLGALMEDDGRLAVLPAVQSALQQVDPRRAAAYAPIAGEPGYLSAVVADVFGAGAASQRALAVATPGGTGALHHAIVNFLEPGQALLTTSYFWGPYETIASHTRRKVETFEMFDAGGTFHLEAFERGLGRCIERQQRALVLLNTPCHNPTGYALDARELAALAQIVRRAAQRAPVVLLLDWAYARFGRDAGPDWSAPFEDLGPNGLLLVAWTASKSFAQYGARVGALVAAHADPEERRRLFQALAFSCRGTWSNCNHLGMLAIARLLSDPAARAQVDRERERLIELLDQRVRAFNRLAGAARLRYPRYEGGFFVTVFTPEPERTAARMRDAGVFVVPVRGAVRVALCSTPADDVPRLVQALVEGLRAAGS